MFLLLANHPDIDTALLWPGLAAFLILCGAWEWYTGTTGMGAHLTFDSSDTGPFVILVGFKFVIAALILIVYFIDG